MRFQVGLQHLRQIGIDRAARFAVAMSLPSAQLAVTAHDQVGEPIPTGATAFRALDPKHVELADQVAEDDRAVAGHVHWLFVLHHKFAPHIKNLFDQFIDFRGIQGQDQSRPVFNVNDEPNAAAIFCDRELQLAVNHGSSGRALLEKTIAGLSSSRGDEFYELKPKPLGGGIIHRKRRCCTWRLNIENHSIRPSQPDTNLVSDESVPPCCGSGLSDFFAIWLLRIR